MTEGQINNIKGRIGEAIVEAILREAGYQVCRALKNDESVKDIPVIMLTAKIQESEKHWARECGCDGYIAKPFELEDLRKVIEAQLEKRKTKA